MLIGRSLHPVMTLDGTLYAKPVVNNAVYKPRDLMTVFSHQAYAKVILHTVNTTLLFLFCVVLVLGFFIIIL